MRVLSKTFIKCFPLGSPPKCKGGGLIYESNTNLYEMQSHPGRFLGQHASDADSNGQRRMEAGRTIMLPNAMMQMPIQMQQYCIIQWLQQKARVRRLRTKTRSHCFAEYIYSWGLSCRVLVGEGLVSQGFLRGHGDSELSGIGWGRGQRFLREHGN